MSDVAGTLGEQIAAKKAELARLERRAELLPKAQQCAELGHDWRHIGGRNAGCGGDACSCSVPVHECARCGDCDYGENDEAEKTMADCAADRGISR